jgi:hypothetical protein
MTSKDSALVNSRDVARELCPAILFLLELIAVQSNSDVFGGFLIAGSRDRFARVGKDLILLCVDRKIFGLKRFLFGHCIISRVGL